MNIGKDTRRPSEAALVLVFPINVDYTVDKTGVQRVFCGRSDIADFHR